MKKTLAIVLFILLLSSCKTTTNPRDVDPTNINQLENLTQQNDEPTGPRGVSPLRQKALEDTAMSIGAQGGLASMSQQINARLNRDRLFLETVYNFNGMMLSHGVIPPVLAEGDFSLNLANSDTIRVADRTYKIVQQARFATTPPNWREYLWMPFNKPELPNRVLLPRNMDEQKIWRQAIKVGWEKGTEQAYNIFQQNLARLKRDYSGMALYRKLLQHKMISAPYVSRTELGITGNGEDMRINDQVLRITELPKLQTDSDNWKAVVVKQ